MRQPCKKYTSLPLTFALSVSLCQPKTPLAVLPHVGEAGLKDDTNSVKCLFGLNDFQTPEDQGVPLPDGPIIGKKKKKSASHNKSRVLALSKPHWEAQTLGSPCCEATWRQVELKHRLIL